MATKKQIYNDYINSLAWRLKRQEYFAAKDMPQGCQGCGYNGKYLEIHHKTYDRLGNEQLTDLVPVCHDCHMEIHRGFDMWKNNLWAHTENVLARIQKSGRQVPTRTVLPPGRPGRPLYRPGKRKVQTTVQRQRSLLEQQATTKLNKAKKEAARQARRQRKVKSYTMVGTDRNDELFSNARDRQAGRTLTLEERIAVERRRNGL